MMQPMGEAEQVAARQLRGAVQELGALVGAPMLAVTAKARAGHGFSWARGLAL